PGPAQPRPFNAPTDSDDESDVEPSAVNDEAESGMIDDGARWLDKRRKLRGAAISRDVLDDAAKSRSQAPPALKTNTLPAKASSKAVPKASDWESW
ncbi:hypothetical protein PAXRUDRAFT_157641, partial [Paxillus rubicundulus Ve08.2h10]